MRDGVLQMVGGLAIVALLFVGLSLAPNWRSPQGGAALASAAPAAQAGPPQPAYIPQPSAPTAAPLAPSYTFREERKERPEHRSWLYAQQNVTLLISPGGRAHIPPSLCKEPLIIVRGTRLWPVKTEGSWIMVRSPSHLLGWVPQAQVDARSPYVYRD